MRRMSEPVSGDYYQVAPLTGRWRVVVGIAVAVVLAAGVVLRFVTPSALWLDEALTVNIARLPLHEIPSHLKQDGAPPLFYYLLHFWMLLFGQSDVATRSLSGIIGVATIPVAFFVGRRLGGKLVGWTAAVLFGECPLRRLLLDRGAHVRVGDLVDRSGHARPAAGADQSAVQGT